jgi:hypothetical protein
MLFGAQKNIIKPFTIRLGILPDSQIIDRSYPAVPSGEETFFFQLQPQLALVTLSILD